MWAEYFLSNMLALTCKLRCSWCFLSWSVESFSSSLVRLISSPLSSDWSAASNWLICMEFLGCHCWPCGMEGHLSLGDASMQKVVQKKKLFTLFELKLGLIFSNKQRWINLDLMTVRKKWKCPLFLPLVSAIETFSPIFQANRWILQLITLLLSSRSVFPPSVEHYRNHLRWLERFINSTFPPSFAAQHQPFISTINTRSEMKQQLLSLSLCQGWILIMTTFLMVNSQILEVTSHIRIAIFRNPPRWSKISPLGCANWLNSCAKCIK